MSFIHKNRTIRTCVFFFTTRFMFIRFKVSLVVAYYVCSRQKYHAILHCNLSGEEEVSHMASCIDTKPTTRRKKINATTFRSVSHEIRTCEFTMVAFWLVYTLQGRYIRMLRIVYGVWCTSKLFFFIFYRYADNFWSNKNALVENIRTCRQRAFYIGTCEMTLPPNQWQLSKTFTTGIYGDENFEYPSLKYVGYRL